MNILKILCLTMTFILINAFLISCSPQPPVPGQTITYEDMGVSITVTSDWILEVESPDWSTWTRIQKGRTNEPWIFPRTMATNTGAGTFGANNRERYWKFKGVPGVFDPNVNPMTSAYPSPPGLWIMESSKIELLETVPRTLEWPSISGTEATCRLYETVHGTGATATIWHTYTVVFSISGNTYEFVMPIPDDADHRDWIDAFWESVEDVSVPAGAREAAE